MLDFDKVVEFENLLANFFGSKYCVATDSCTHAIELCLRLKHPNCVIKIPKHTYISIPFTLQKLNLHWDWEDNQWKEYYYLKGTNIIDAAVYWKQNGFLKNTFMCLSFQSKKHLSLGRGGAILLDNLDEYKELKRLSYDGRDFNGVPWYEQNIKSFGYHYYMTPETANNGILKFLEIKKNIPRNWSFLDYPNLTKMDVFLNKKCLN